MAGELLFRILDQQALATVERRGQVSWTDAKKIFLDRGSWSLTPPSGQNYLVIDGSAFFDHAPWMYEGHQKFAELPLEKAETATLLIPRELVSDWRRRLQLLAVDGVVAGSAQQARGKLLELMDTVLNSDDLGLTVQSIL